MANPEQLALLKQGVDAWNAWREENPEVILDLRKANLYEVRLEGANLEGAILFRAILFQADLREAKLVGANLIGANLFAADLRGTRLEGARLEGASLVRANLERANLSEARLGNTSFGDTILTDAKNLETCVHRGPSNLDHRTLAHNLDLPEAFLRGCGLSDADIEYAKLYRPNLTNNQINDIVYKIYDLRATQSIQINPLFISYSHADSSFVDRVEKELDGKGVRYWRDKHHATAGRLEKQVDRAIRHNPTVLLVLSEHSVESDWVEYEAQKARELGKELKRDVLCPVALDGSWQTCAWEGRLRQQIMKYNVLDFSEWQDSATFDTQFDRLLRGLRIFYEPEDEG